MLVKYLCKSRLNNALIDHIAWVFCQQVSFYSFLMHSHSVSTHYSLPHGKPNRRYNLCKPNL